MLEKPKQSQSPVVTRKHSSGSSHQRARSALVETVDLFTPPPNVTSKDDTTRGRSRPTVIRYTEKSSLTPDHRNTGITSTPGDLWTSQASNNGVNIYETVYGGGVLLDGEKTSGLKGASSSEEDLTDGRNVLPREPSIRISANTYHNQKSFSTFAASPEENHQQSDGIISKRHSVHVVNPSDGFSNHIYDTPDNQINNSKRDNAKSGHHHYETPYGQETSVNENRRSVPQPPKRSTSLMFEDVSIPSEPYQPLGTFLAPSSMPQPKEKRHFDKFEGAIVHVTHESTKSPEETEKAFPSEMSKISENSSKKVDKSKKEDLNVENVKLGMDVNNGKKSEMYNGDQYSASDSPSGLQTDSNKIITGVEEKPKIFQDEHQRKIVENESEENETDIVSELSHPGSDYTLKDMDITGDVQAGHVDFNGAELTGL